MCKFLMKAVLFIVNFVLTVIGLALAAIGILIVVQFSDVFQELLAVIPVNLKFIPYVVIGLGAFIFIIGFCGCCGSVRESQCMLLTYAVFVGIIAAIKIAIAVALFTSVDNFKERVDTALEDIFVDTNLNATFHMLESTLGCCGTTGPKVYNITYNGTEYVPYTCCTEGIIGEYKICPIEYAYDTGCITVMNIVIDNLSTNSRNVLIIVVVAELLVMSFAIYIACTSKKR